MTFEEFKKFVVEYIEKKAPDLYFDYLVKRYMYLESLKGKNGR